MVSFREHGGHCCGARHIYGFNTGTGPRDTDVATLRHLTHNGGDNGKRIEVILNGEQIRNRQDVLDELANLGYVFVEKFVNSNHNSDCYVFSRAGRRKTLTFPRGVTWNGMTINPGLGGTLQTLPAAPAVRGDNGNLIVPVRGHRLDTIYSRNLQAGDIVLYHNEGHVQHGRSFVLVSNYPDYRGYYEIREQVGTGESFRRASSRLTFHERPGPAVAPDQPQAYVYGNQRHTQEDVEQLLAPVAVTNVVTLYFNRYQDGREGALFRTREECEAAAPRCRSRFQRTYKSDGTFEDEILL